MTGFLNKFKSKKGFTLVEMCTVLALVAVIVAMIVCFSMLMTNRTSQASLRNSVLVDVSNVELGVKQWINSFDNKDYIFAIADSSDNVIREDDNRIRQSEAFGVELRAYDTKGTSQTGDDALAATVKLADNKEKLLCEGAGDISVEHIKEVKFSLKKPENKDGGSSGNLIITCDITYRDPSEGKGEGATSTTKVIFTTHSGAIVK